MKRLLFFSGWRRDDVAEQVLDRFTVGLLEEPERTQETSSLRYYNNVKIIVNPYPVRRPEDTHKLENFYPDS